MNESDKQKLKHAAAVYRAAKSQMELIKKAAIPDGALIALPYGGSKVVGLAIGVGMCPDLICIKRPEKSVLPKWVGAYYDAPIEEAEIVECPHVANGTKATVCGLCVDQGGCPIPRK